MVKTIDNNGVVRTQRLQLNDLWVLPSNLHVILEWNEVVQLVGQGVGLLGLFIGQMGKNYFALPITYKTWKEIPGDYKELILTNVIEKKENSLTKNLALVGKMGA